MILETITGEVLDARVRGADFWGTANLRTLKGARVMVVGKLLGVQPGDTVEVQGAWSEHERFGKQFKARSIATTIPKDVSGIVGWMQARLPQLGAGRARAMVEHFGADRVWNVIENNPDRLLEIPGITEDRRNAIVAAYHEHRGERDRVVRFKSWGLTDAQIARVVSEWGDHAEEKIRENPYELSEKVHGFGFVRADTVARRMGLPLDAPARIRAGIIYVLREWAAKGHTYIFTGHLGKACASVLEITDTEVYPQLRALYAERRVWTDEPEHKMVALAELARAEEMVASRLRDMRQASQSSEGKAA